VTLVSTNPATGEVLDEFPEFSPADVHDALSALAKAQGSWARRGMSERTEALRRAASILRERAGFYARTITREMGKPICEARAEVVKCATVLDHYADNGAAYLAPETFAANGSQPYVAFRPLGTVLAVMPWNFPFWQVFRLAAPTLVAGNAVALKHAPSVQGCARLIEEVFTAADFPDRVLTNFPLAESRVTGVIGDPRIAAVALTGSVRAGRQVATAAGAALKKCLLELGGSDPFVVLTDANIEAAVETGVTARCANAGQTCIAAKRFIVAQEIFDEFLWRFRERMAGLAMGDPLKEETRIGPLARFDLRETLHEQVRASIAAGAELVLGGEIPEEPGAWYPPTILVDPPKDAPAYREELFGPVAVVLRAGDEAHALELANATEFGLGGSVWTQDARRGERFAARIEAGTVAVNGMVKSDPRLPFGGVKHSGYGRELGAYGIREFVNVQTVWPAG
jgi:succinate-semialdehyde dehydrogenase/glutarate-semialdehyde dehydrogenase